MVGKEGDGCAVPFQEHTDKDNDLVTFEAPTEQEIIESLEEVDRVGPSESDDQPEDIVPHGACGASLRLPKEKKYETRVFM